jgi:hypothetical protein
MTSIPAYALHAGTESSKSQRIFPEDEYEAVPCRGANHTPLLEDLGDLNWGGGEIVPFSGRKLAPNQSNLPCYCLL